MIHTSDLFASDKDCCGCEACSQICPQKIIQMTPAYDGFLYPNAFDPSKCTDCHLCLKVCPLKSIYRRDLPIGNYAGYSKNEQDIKLSASGGLATSLTRQFITDGGIVYGVRYTNDFKKIKYCRCSDLLEIECLRGSKYAQSEKTNLYYQIKKDINENRKILFFGLPCDVRALRMLYGNYDDLYTVALICHGPTSQLVHKEYINNILSGHSGVKVKYFTVRGKKKGWKPYYIKLIGTNGFKHEEIFLQSTYGIAFAELKRPSCSVCKFKIHNEYSGIDADLIIGDFHGASPGSVQYNNWGSSQVSIQTIKGEKLITNISHTFNLAPISLYQAIHYNRALGRIIKPRWNRNQFAKVLSIHGLNQASKLRSVRFINLYEALIMKTKRLIAKTTKSIRR